NAQNVMKQVKETTIDGTDTQIDKRCSLLEDESIYIEFELTDTGPPKRDDDTGSTTSHAKQNIIDTDAISNVTVEAHWIEIKKPVNTSTSSKPLIPNDLDKLWEKLRTIKDAHRYPLPNTTNLTPIGTYTNMIISTESTAKPPTPETIFEQQTINNHNSIRHSTAPNNGMDNGRKKEKPPVDCDRRF
ncbi:7009_t:CDS:2, partial [Gigaspora margarita]